MITAVAIKVNDKIYSLPRPARHADIMEFFRIKWDDPKVEGFLDDDNVFVDRVDAMKIAKRCNQPLIDFWNDLNTATELYSENLW